MTMPRDVTPAPASPLLESAPLEAFHLQEEVEAPCPFQQINARRAKVENPELLRGLRSL